MNSQITITSARQLKRIKNVIFESVIDNDLQVHIVCLHHQCDTNLVELMENKHPAIRVITITQNMIEEFMALHLVLQVNSGKGFHRFCPSCGIETLSY